MDEELLLTEGEKGMRGSRLIKKKSQSVLVNWILLWSLFIVPLLISIKPVGAPDWWDPGWAFRKQVAINSTMVSGDLVNFPVLLDIVDMDLKTKARSDGGDIVFLDANNVKLSHEIEQYDSSSGHLVAWVTLPSLVSTQDTILHMYYGNPDARNQQNASAVWDSNFVMIQHLKELFLNRYDSTTNGNNGTAYGGLLKSTAGKIDGADEFDGYNDYVGVQSSTSLNISGAVTVEGWFNSKLGLLSKPNAWFGGMQKLGAYELGWQGWTDGWTFQIYENGNRLYIDSNNVYVPQGEWHYVVGQYDGQYLRVFLDGQSIASKMVGSRTIVSNNNAFQIGVRESKYWNGTIDEVRISNVSRSSAWIQTSYNNQKNPAAFCLIGTEEMNPNVSGPLVSDENPSDQTTDAYTNPTLSIRVLDPAGQNVTIIFQEKVLNAWQVLATLPNVPSGVYSVTAKDMNKLGTTYYWQVCVTDGQGWTNETFSFTTTTKILQQKWVASPFLMGVSGVLTYDVNGDGKEEVFFAGVGGVVCLSGDNGSLIWNVSDSAIGVEVKPQMGDLDGDGIPEIIVPLEQPAGLLALHANNGSQYWRILGLGYETYGSPVMADIDGSGHPTIFFASTDVFHGLNGTGKLSAISYNGTILRQTTVWRPCGGGLSIADTDGDGEFELYMGDRFVYEPDNDYGKGVQSYWARNLTLRWYRPDIVCSSHIPMLADVNKDGIMEVIIGHLDGGLAVLNSTDGSVMNMTLGIPDKAPVHYQASVCDIDGDGNLEMLMADFHNETSDDLVVWDLVKWKQDASLYIGKCFYGPQEADVTGDGIPEIIACNLKSIMILDRSYRLIDGVIGLTSGEVNYGGQVQNIDGVVGVAGTLNYAVVQDIDGDGYNELVVSSQSGYVYAFDTPARRPSLRPRTEVQFYSERRLGVAEYVPPPGCLQPVITSINPPDTASNVPLSLTQIQFNLADYQHQSMNYTITTNPNIGADSGTNVTSGKYTLNITKLAPQTTYTWAINLTDGVHWTNATFTFTTESVIPWLSPDWPYRKKITIIYNKVSADLQNFPVLVSINNDTDLASKARQDGGDIVFADASNNRLNFETELFNSTIGSLIAWVNVPQLSSTTNTIIYMYYGNSSIQNQQNPTAVWDSNYVMVQHLKEMQGTRYDSTSNHNDGMPIGLLNQSTYGKIDGAIDFSGVNGSLGVQNSPSLNITGQVTVEGWFNSKQGLASKPNAWYGGMQKSGAYELSWQGWSDGWTFQIFENGTRYYVDSINAYMLQGDWHYVVGAYDGQTLRVFIDGQSVVSKIVGSRTVTTNNNTYQIGICESKYWNGTIDEVRISNTYRSAAWIQTNYNNQKDPAAFLAIGGEESVPDVIVISSPSPQDKAQGVSISLSELDFSIANYRGGLMNYTVTTSPDVGSASNTSVTSGRFKVSISGLKYFTTYKWTISVTDGNQSTSITYSFSTLPSEPPTQDTPILQSNAGNLVCTNQTTSDPDGDNVTNIYHWFRNNTSTTNLLLPFDTNSSTTVKDYSGYGNDGTIVRGVSWTSNGKIGGAYVFNRGLIQIPASSVIDGGGNWPEITVEHWIYLTATQSGTKTIARLPSYEIGLINNQVYGGIWIVTGNTTISGYNRVLSNLTLLTNTWYHVAMTYQKNGNLALYINSPALGYTEIVSKTIDLTWYLSQSDSATRPLVGNIEAGGTTPLYIGWYDYFKGMIDEVRVYPKCLSSQQIYQRYIETRAGSSNSSSIVSQETNTGETWKCTVIPNDSHQDGTAKTSNTFTIGYNNRPIAKGLKITPSTPNTDDNLTASYTYFDPDGDLESGTEIRWYKNGLLQPQLNDTLMVPANLTTKGETWFFTVKPSDGKDFGDLQISPAVTIQNTPPSITGVTITPNPAYANDTLTANPLSPYDPDGDVITFTYQWQKYENGTWTNIEGATNQTLGPENFVQGDQIQVICTPYDGQNYGTPKEDALTIL